MKEIIFTIILGVSIIMATKKDNNYIVRPVYSVDSVKVLKAADNEILLKTISTVPNPCYQFSHIETEKNKNQIRVTVFAKIDKNVNCISIIGIMEAEIKIAVPKAGMYKIVFLGKTKKLEKYIGVKSK